MKYALAYFFDWDMTLTFWPDKASAEAACLDALNRDAETDCATLEEWQALDWGGRPWDYRMSPVPSDPGPTPSRSDLLDAAGALREVAADREGEGDAVAVLYTETADRLEAIGQAMPKPGAAPSPPSDVLGNVWPIFTDDQYRAAAAARHEREGTLEIDPGAPVSRGDDPGAYVQAWLWVSNDELDREA